MKVQVEADNQEDLEVILEVVLIEEISARIIQVCQWIADIIVNLAEEAEINYNREKIWIEFIKFMIKIPADNILVRKEETLNKDKVDINSKKEVLTIRASGKIIKCRVKDSLTSNKDNFNTQANGSPMNITDGEFFIAILN